MVCSDDSFPFELIPFRKVDIREFSVGAELKQQLIAIAQRGLGTSVPVCHSSGAFFFTGQVCFKGVLEFWDGNDEVNTFFFGKVPGETTCTTHVSCWFEGRLIIGGIDHPTIN